MKNTKKSFVLFSSWEKTFAKLPPEQQGELIMAIFAYAGRGELPDDASPLVDVAFSSFQDGIDENQKRWAETCKARSIAGKKGGRPRKDAPLQEPWQPEIQPEAQSAEACPPEVPDAPAEPQVKAKPPVAPVTAYGTHQWVKLTQSQFELLEQKLGTEELHRCITYLDESAQITNNKNGWHDWAVTIQRCSRDQWGIQKQKKQAKQKKSIPMGSAGQGSLSTLEQKALEELQREYGLAHSDEPPMYLYCKSDTTPNLPGSISAHFQGGVSHA